MIMIASLAGRTAPSEIVAGAASGAAVFLALAAVRGLCRPGSLGGADIKLSAASACVLGIFRCCAAVAAGVSIALAVSAVQNRSSARVGSFRYTAFPFVPYLTAGCMLSALF
jgi:prepilin signal peptidase PulO-like enzyme (type II secretory pathway)